MPLSSDPDRSFTVLADSLPVSAPGAHLRLTGRHTQSLYPDLFVLRFWNPSDAAAWQLRNAHFLEVSHGETLLASGEIAEITQETDRLHALPVSAAGHVTQGTVQGGEGSAYSYVIGSDADGDLYITVPLPQVVDEELNALYEQLRQQLEAGEITVEDVLEMDLPLPERNSDWDLEASNEQAARPMGVIDGDDQVSAYFRPGEETGAVTLRLFDRVTDDTITVECENNGGTLIVLSHTLTTD